MTNHIHNLDEGVQEYFEFIVLGFTYRFRQPNGEEMEKIKDLSKEGEEKKSEEYLYSFIEKTVPEQPDFAEIGKKMIAPQWRRLTDAIKTEIGG